MNKKRVFIALAVIVALVWGAVAAVKAVRTPKVTKAPVAIEQPIAKVEAPYTVTPTKGPYETVLSGIAKPVAPQCKADPKLLPKKVQPKAKVIAPAQPVVKAKPSAKYHSALGNERLPVLLPN